jgi:hypothetical protein
MPRSAAGSVPRRGPIAPVAASPARIKGKAADKGTSATETEAVTPLTNPDPAPLVMRSGAENTGVTGLKPPARFPVSDGSHGRSGTAAVPPKSRKPLCCRDLTR